MTLETLRTPLLLSLVAVVAWMITGACLGEASPPFDILASQSLCIHR
jgi:hypothetical protein